MLDLIKQPWPWYVAGPLIGLLVPFLLITGNKTFGISSTLRHMCAAIIPANIPFFQYDWKKEVWNLVLVSGVFIGAIIAINFLSNSEPTVVNPELTKELAQYGITNFNYMVPVDIVNWGSLLTLKGILMMVMGGFFIGFGTRYAGGCTSGHAISGLSALQLPSLIATCSFMLGGFITANLILPLILSL